MSVFLFFTPWPDEKPDDLVGVEYVMRRFGCSRSAVYQRKCGTHVLHRVTSSPLRFRRGDVDEAIRQLYEASLPKKPGHGLVRRRR